MTKLLMFIACSMSIVHAAVSFSMYHRFDKKAVFSIPMNASALQPHIDPMLKIDQDQNGVAWMSIIPAQLVNVPFLKPIEIQVLTYVIGPDPVTKQPVKGLMAWDVAFNSGPAIAVASRLLPSSVEVEQGEGMEIRCDFKTDTRIPYPGTNNYEFKGSKLAGSADIHASAVIKRDSIVRFNVDFFLDRTAWFGRSKEGELAVTMLRDNKFDRPHPMQVGHLFSDVFSALGLGTNMTEDICMQHEESCFFIGEHEVNIESAVTIANTTHFLV